ncbi:hypothetical protein PINS_up007463 [Pythium insidiosum]|nr:hypothetical protein PINS_up007463 [Pythium insidiosum]
MAATTTTSAETAAAPDREAPSLLQQLTLDVSKTFRGCSSSSHHHAAPSAAAERDGDGAHASSAAPEPASSARRVLTKNAEPKHNGGLDNTDRNLIVRVRDVLGGKDALPSQPDWVVLDLLGQGTFGQVFRCQHADTKEIVAVKVIRNHPSYYKQALVEVQITNLLNRSYSEREAPHIVRLLDTFEFRHHLCLVFELLSLNVYELIAENNFNGFPMEVTRGFLQQILHAMIQMEDTGVIHCDLKPENILLVGYGALVVGLSICSSSLDCITTARTDSSRTCNTTTATTTTTIQTATPLHPPPPPLLPSSTTTTTTSAAQTPFVKVVDFGSACLENETVYSYIQSRFYRSPEVLLGIPYTGAIDVWSLGCIAVEMFLGLPLFPGVSEHDQLRLIEETLGRLPQDLLRRGRHVLKFYNVREDCELVLKTPSEYARENDAEVQISKKYFKHSRLRDMVHAYPYGADSSAAQRDTERQQRDAFLDLVLQLLAPDPEQRCTARDALAHSFISGHASHLDHKQRSSDSVATSPRPNAVAPFPPSSDAADRFPSSAAANGAYAAYGSAFSQAATAPAAAATATAAAAHAIWPYSFGPVREGSHVWGYPSGSAAQLLTPSLFFPTDRARDTAVFGGISHSLPVPAFPLTHQAAVMPVYASAYPVVAPVLSDVYHYNSSSSSKVAPLVPVSGESRAAAVVPMAETATVGGNWGATQHWQWQEDRYGCHGWPYPSQTSLLPEASTKRSQGHGASGPQHNASGTRRPHHRQPAPTQAPRDHTHGAKSRGGRKDVKTTAVRSKDGGTKRHRLEQRPTRDATLNEQTVCAVEENMQRSAISIALELEPASSAVSLPT